MRLLLLAACMPLAAIACSGHQSAPVQKWTCAMHPQIVRNHAGDCPICGMKLVSLQSPPGSAPTTTAKSERKILFYRAPMNPQERSPIPKKDAMGMAYVPVYADEAQPTVDAPSGLAAITIDPQRQQLIGLRTAVIEKGTLDASLRTTGRVAFDETKIVKVQPRFEGFIERLDANFTGKAVRKGQTLATIYSPELLATEQEFLLALQSHDSLVRSGLPDVSEAARERLSLWGISDREIDSIAKQGKPVRALPLQAPISGYVIAKTVVQGARVGPNDALFEIADLSNVWVLADVYEYELPRVHLGQAATITLSYWPDRKWQGRVSYVFPTVDEKTRTVRVRVVVPNSNLELKPEMYADVAIQTASRQALLVPDDAVIESGTRKVVFLARDAGKLMPREIETGLHGDGFYEVRSGLQAGDRVALGASFLLDSESQLKAALQSLKPPESTPTPTREVVP